MTTGIETPFAIGQEWWAPIGAAERVTVPCPVCFGRLAVAVILGNDERVGVPCEACGKGFSGPQGTIDEWVHHPSARRFVIARVASMWNDRWTLESEDGQSRQFHELCATEAEALATATTQAAEQHEQNMRSRQHKRKNVANATWSVRYHRKCIDDLERQIAWHRSQIEAKATTPKAADLDTVVEQTAAMYGGLPGAEEERRPDRAEDSPSYRQDLRDAGRGHLIGE